MATNLALQDFAERHGDEYADFKTLLLHVHAGVAFHSYEPIRGVDVVVGLKIRPQSRTGGWLIEAMGATPVGAPVTKVPEMLSKRVVDAVIIPYEIAKKRNHPHLELFHVAGWLSLFTLHAIWPFLWIWATLYREDQGWGMGATANDGTLEQRLATIEARLVELEPDPGE